MEKAQKVISAPVVEIPPGGREPIGNLAPRDAGKLAEELVAYHSQYADLYQRREQRQWAEFYLNGQLSDLERKTVEPMVLALKGPAALAVRAVQQLAKALGRMRRCSSDAGSWSHKTSANRTAG